MGYDEEVEIGRKAAMLVMQAFVSGMLAVVSIYFGFSGYDPILYLITGGIGIALLIGCLLTVSSILKIMGIDYEDLRE
jgi:hypothetical protein